MHTIRILKRTIYGVLYLVLIAVVVGVGWSVNRLIDPPPVVTPSPTALDAIAPVVIQDTTVISRGSQVDLTARLLNENSRHGIAEYPIVFTVYDAAGVSVGSREVVTYLLPGAIRLVSVVDVPLNGEAAYAEVTLPSSPAWEEVSQGISVPQLSIFLRERSQRTIGTNAVVQQTGVVTNNSTFGWQRVEVTGVALDDSGTVIGTASTFLGNLRVGDQREFSLQWPAAPTPVASVTVVASTNMFADENIRREMGDPSQLR